MRLESFFYYFYAAQHSMNLPVRMYNDATINLFSTKLNINVSRRINYEYPCLSRKSK